MAQQSCSLPDPAETKRRRYISADAEVQMHIHAGLRCAPTTKTYKRRFEKRLAELQDERDAAREEWRKFAPPEPSRKERLIAAANGHPDLASTHAARKICEKNGYCWLTGDS